MRFVLVLFLVGLVMGGVGCAGSSSEIRTAKTAVYATKIEYVLDMAMQAAQEKYVLDGVEAANHRFKTQMQGYNAEGGRQSAGKDSFVNMKAGSIMLYFVVEAKLVGDGAPGAADRVAVVITPKTFQRLDFSPKPRELTPDDPNLPGWVKGRVDALAVAVYDRLKTHAVKDGEAPAAAPATTPEPAPAAPTEPAAPVAPTEPAPVAPAAP